MSNGTIVRYGCPKTSRLYEPSSISGIPKRWKAEAKDLITLPAFGTYTTYFELSGDDDEKFWRKELWLQGFETGQSYEVVIPEDTSIVYWKSGTTEELVSVKELLGPDWPQDHLKVEFISEPKAIFTVL